MAKRRKRSSDETTLFEGIDQAPAGSNGSDGGDPHSAIDADGERYIPLHETARTKYLNYALSVITSRALPDVRDGLKPVHRRILYTMFEELRLTADSQATARAPRWSATSSVSYHPHGDSRGVRRAWFASPRTFCACERRSSTASGNFGSHRR